MKERTYQWYLKPKNDAVNEQICALLAREGISPAESEHAFIEVDGKQIPNVLEVPRYIVDMIEKSDVHHSSVKVYVQQGEGKIRLWKFQNASRRKLARTKAVKDMEKQLKNKGM